VSVKVGFPTSHSHNLSASAWLRGKTVIGLAFSSAYIDEIYLEFWCGQHGVCVPPSCAPLAQYTEAGGNLDTGHPTMIEIMEMGVMNAWLSGVSCWLSSSGSFENDVAELYKIQLHNVGPQSTSTLHARWAWQTSLGSILQVYSHK
jgi:hypothetical protein